MATLYELTGDMLKLQELLDEGELSEEALADAMQYTKDELEEKLQDYCKIMRYLQSEAELLETEEKRLAARRSSIEKNVEKLKNRMFEAMKACDIPKSKGAYFTIFIKKNAPSVAINKEAVQFIPEEYLVPQDPKLDRKKIKEVLEGEDEKAKEKLEGIAYLQQTESLNIR